MSPASPCRFKLPAGYTPTFVPSEYDAATGIWTVGAMVRGQFNRLALNARVEHTGPYDVTAAIASSSQPDPNDSNNTVSAAIVPNRNADLGLVFRDRSVADAAHWGQEAFFVRIDNFGPSEATGITARFTVPAGLYLDRNAPDYDNATGILTIGHTGHWKFQATDSESNRSGHRSLRRDRHDYRTAVSRTPTPRTIRSVRRSPPDRTADLTRVLCRSTSRQSLARDERRISSSRSITTDLRQPAASLPNSRFRPGIGTLRAAPRSARTTLSTGVWTIGAIPAGGLARLLLNGIVNDTGFTGLSATVVSDAPDPNLANNSVTFPPINRPPAINAGPDQTATTNILVNLDGTGSGDPENDAVNYAWMLLLRPANSTATLAGGNSPNPSFVPDQPGRYVVQLSATDSHGFAGTPDTVTITAALGDRAPMIISTPVTHGAVGQLFRYDVDALELDTGDVLTFSLDTSPAGMFIDPATGLITWTPSEGQGGAQPVRVRVQ